MLSAQNGIRNEKRSGGLRFSGRISQRQSTCANSCPSLLQLAKPKL